VDLGERRIRSLQLCGSDDARLRQAHYMLDEAFRTASLPGLPPNGVVLVRRLDLGNINLGVSAVGLALQIEERVRQLAAAAVCVDERSAPKADVVWFSDPLQPYICLLQQLLDGRGATEWYWQSLFNGQLLTLNEKTLNTLFLTVQHTVLKSLAPAHLLQACLEPQRLVCLMQLISPRLARQCLHESGVTPVAVDDVEIHPGVEVQIVPIEGTAPPPDLGDGWLRALSQAAKSWGAGDVRSQWLAYQTLVFNHPAYGERSDALLQVKRWLPTWLADARGISSISDIPPGGAQFRTSSQEQVKNKAVSEVQEVQSPRRTALLSAEITLASGTLSVCAGFGLVINLLQRCGMAELMTSNERLAANDFHLYLLHAIARRFGMEKDDPLMPLFDTLEDIGDMVLSELSLPASCWSTVKFLPLQYRQLGQSDQPVSAHQLMVVMQLLMGCYLRRYGQLSLRQLVYRPGRVVLSRSHWDVVFDINQTDLRLRRLALDSDPGWVPWLGKVVQFHYDTQGYRYV